MTTSFGESDNAAGSAHRVVSRIPRRLKNFLALDDFENAARRRLPRQIYGYYAGAAESNRSRDANLQSYRDIALVPRVLNDTSARDTSTTLFGRNYRQPVGICPMGLSALATFEGDLVLAQAASKERIPMVVSATSLMPLERLACEGDAHWFQAYLPGDDVRIRSMVDRVAAAGYKTLVLTVDVPVAANRENNVRTGFSIPLEPSLRLLWDGITHPAWSAFTFGQTLLGGMPRFENMDSLRGPPILSRNLVRAIGARDSLSWRHVELIRSLWHGQFVIKGIVSFEDARHAKDCGVDAIWVSNHGGRQLDGAIAPLLVLPGIKAAVGELPVLIDGGIRRGTDVLKALALGANFVFVGRPFLFAAAAAGLAGVRHAIELLRAEIDRDLAMMGVSGIKQLGLSHVRMA